MIKGLTKPHPLRWPEWVASLQPEFCKAENNTCSAPRAVLPGHMNTTAPLCGEREAGGERKLFDLEGERRGEEGGERGRREGRRTRAPEDGVP